MCVNYGGRAEIADAAAAIAARGPRPAGSTRTKVDERTVARYLDEPDMPDVDLFVRTSGEQRTSQLPALAVGLRRAGVPGHALAGLRPDRHLWQAVETYARRDRRYGGAVDAAGNPV